MEAEDTKVVNKLANASWIVGWVGIFLYAFTYGILGVISCIAAIVLAIVGLVQIKKTGEGGKDRAIFGIILGVIPLLAGGYMWFVGDGFHDWFVKYFIDGLSPNP